MNIPEELLPVVEWWEKDGKKTAVIVVAVLAVFAAYKGYVAHREAKKVAAGSAVLTAYTTAQLEDAVSEFQGMAAEGVLKLRLAKSYYDAGRYDEAKDLYDSFGGVGPEGFEDVPAVGAALCLEAVGEYDAALAAFDEFVQNKPESLYALTAKLGAARVIALKGDKEEALKKLDAVKAEVKDDAASTAIVETMISTVRRYQKKAEEAAPTPIEQVEKIEAGTQAEK